MRSIRDRGSSWASTSAATGCARRSQTSPAGFVARAQEHAARSSDARVAQIGELAHRLAADAGIDWRQVTHATVGSSGVLDPTSGALALAPNIPGWGRHGLVETHPRSAGRRRELRERREPGSARRELARRRRRASRTSSSSPSAPAWAWASSSAGELFRGAYGAAGEIAYAPIGHEDPYDPGVRRRGALEEAAGASGVVRHARELGHAAAAHRRVASSMRPARATRAATQVVDAEAGRIALALAAVAPILDPELVILGGGIAGGASDLLTEQVASELARLSPFRPRLTVSAARRRRRGARRCGDRPSGGAGTGVQSSS